MSAVEMITALALVVGSAILLYELTGELVGWMHDHF